jgi:hypothetical protein
MPTQEYMLEYITFVPELLPNRVEKVRSSIFGPILHLQVLFVEIYLGWRRNKLAGE